MSRPGIKPTATGSWTSGSCSNGSRQNWNKRPRHWERHFTLLFYWGSMDKRCSSTQEAAWAYLGLKRRSFEMHIAPLFSGKWTKVGVSVVYERTDLDDAWEQFKEQRARKEKAQTPPAKGGRASPHSGQVSGYTAAVAQLRLREKSADAVLGRQTWESLVPS